MPLTAPAFLYQAYSSQDPAVPPAHAASLPGLQGLFPTPPTPLTLHSREPPLSTQADWPWGFVDALPVPCSAVLLIQVVFLLPSTMVSPRKPALRDLPTLTWPLFCVSSEHHILPALHWLESFATSVHLTNMYEGRTTMCQAFTVSAVCQAGRGPGHSGPSEGCAPVNDLQVLSWGGWSQHSDTELWGLLLFVPSQHLTCTKDFYLSKVLVHPLSRCIRMTPLLGRMEGAMIPFERWND